MKSNYPKEIKVYKLGTGDVTEEKTLGVLQESGKIRLEELGNFSRPQVLVVLLGLRGSGKSTTASLLSGNEKMFLQGRSSTKTTTIGIDISSIIPANEYVPAINNALKNSFNNSGSTFPLVFTDSEGIGVKGDSIDFVSTIPPLLFSNVIIWVTTDSLRADEELTKLNRYLNLANKIQDENESILGGDSLDSLSFGSMMSFSNKGQMASKNQVFFQREMSPSPRLCRSNSMRSSKSDKIYSALIQRVEDMENVETMDSVMAQMAQRLYYPPNPMNSSPSSQSYGRSSFGN